MDKAIINWDQYDKIVADIAGFYTSQMHEEKQKASPEYKAVLGLSRGGLSVAVSLAHELDISRVYSLGLTSYDDVEKQQKELQVYQKLDDSALAYLRGNKFILVDDVVDNQTTMKWVRGYLADNGISDKGYSIAALCLKGNKPDWLDCVGVSYSKSEWLVYPYER